MIIAQQLSYDLSAPRRCDVRIRLMGFLLVHSILLWLCGAAQAAVLSGTVIGEGARPIAGATVEVVQSPAQSPCRSTTTTDGTFSFPCAATGRFVVRATYRDLRPWEIPDIDLTADGEVHLNFILVPTTTTAFGDSLAIVARDEQPSLWIQRVTNPVLLHWQQREITLRLLAIVVAPISFVLGALTMLSLGRRFGVNTRRLSSGEVGDLVFNPHVPTMREQITPVAVAGARGRSATMSYGADEIAAALEERRYGLVVVALVVAPGLFALAALAFGTAMLIGQEAYLLCAMLLVPAGFLLTPFMIARQARHIVQQRKAQPR